MFTRTHTYFLKYLPSLVLSPLNLILTFVGPPVTFFLTVVLDNFAPATLFQTLEAECLLIASVHTTTDLGLCKMPRKQFSAYTSFSMSCIVSAAVLKESLAKSLTFPYHFCMLSYAEIHVAFGLLNVMCGECTIERLFEVRIALKKERNPFLLCRCS